MATANTAARKARILYLPASLYALAIMDGAELVEVQKFGFDWRACLQAQGLHNTGQFSTTAELIEVPLCQGQIKEIENVLERVIEDSARRALRSTN